MGSPAEQAFKILQQKGEVGSFIYRPWFDRLTLSGVLEWYQPLSRAWALAESVEFDREAFVAGLAKPLPGERIAERGIDWMLEKGKARRQRLIDANKAWNEAFLDQERAWDQASLLERETNRLEAADRYMASRALYLPLKVLNAIPATKWRVPGVDELAAVYGEAAKTPDDHMVPPEDAGEHLQVSATVTWRGHKHRWLRGPSAVKGNEGLWARVIDPAEVSDPPTVIFLHGISMETDFWVGYEDAIMQAVDAGFRLIRPEGPWHGRRRVPGSSGGEPVLSTAPRGFLDYLLGHIREIAGLIAWARRQSERPVVLAGLSLGALTAQKLASVCGAWPAHLRPDALLLVSTTGHVVGMDTGGALGKGLGLPDALAEAGWSDERLQPYAPLVEPQEAPPFDADRIMMVLGREDHVTEYEGGLALAHRWKVPSANIFRRDQGHFTAYFGLASDPTPLNAFLDKARALDRR